MSARPHLVDQAIGMVKDAIRYTFCYPRRRLTRQACTRTASDLRAQASRHVDRQNSWDGEQYKGINSRWREPESGQLFEVQFHTQASLDAKEVTHSAYEQIRESRPRRRGQAS